MSKQPEALRLADDLMTVHAAHADEGPSTFSEAAAELRRLHVVNGELLEALKLAKNSLVAFKFMPGHGNSWEEHDEENLKSVDAAITKAEAA